MRKPDFVIGRGEIEDAYMLRWYIIPRNKWFNIYLHHILRSDEDEALHDHPWWNVSLVLKGGYWEVMPGDRVAWRGRGSIVLRKATALHRLMVNDKGAWSLFLTGPVIREWGFACPNGWRSFKEFTIYKNSGSTRGRGCG